MTAITLYSKVHTLKIFKNLINIASTMLTSTKSNTSNPSSCKIIKFSPYFPRFNIRKFFYSLYLLFSKCPKEVQEKLLDVFGLLTTLDEDAFRNLAIDLCEEYTNKSKAFKTKLIKSKRPSCPICKGNHWKRDCPKYKFKNKGRKTGYATANNEDESQSKIHEDHLAKVCIKDDRSNAGPDCLLATFLAKERK